MSFNKYLLNNKNFFFSYFVLSFITLFNIFLINIIILFYNLTIFIKNILWELLLIDMFKLNIKFLKEKNRLKYKDKTKWTFLKWFIMWFSLIYPKYLIIKFIFCFVRYLNQYFIFIIKYWLERSFYVNKYSLFYSIYLLFLIYEKIFQFIFFKIPYKLSLFYIQFRILFFLDELNRFVGSNDFDLILDPFIYWYKEYYLPYQNYLDNILPERYFIIKHDIKERKKIFNKNWENFLDILFTFRCKFIFTKESILYKNYTKRYKKNIIRFNRVWNCLIIIKYITMEIFYEISNFILYCIVFLDYVFKLNCTISSKILKYFFFGLFYIFVFVKWLIISFFNI